MFFGSQNLAGNMASDCGATYTGTWGLSAQWNKASFIEGLFHNVRVTYIQGTNSKKMAQYVAPASLGQYLTTKDSVIDVSFDSVYSIYKNLAAMLELSYAFENMDGKLWGKAMGIERGVFLSFRFRRGRSFLHFYPCMRPTLLFSAKPGCPLAIIIIFFMKITQKLRILFSL